jgi:hypothetical protein
MNRLLQLPSANGTTCHGAEAQAADQLEAANDRPEACRPRPLADVEPLLIDAKLAAELCGGISEASWYRLKASGRTPAPVKLGGRVLYRVDDLRLWVRLGCPARKEFEARKAANQAKT